MDNLQRMYNEGTPASLTLFWEKGFHKETGMLHESGMFVYEYKGELRSFMGLNVDGYEGQRLAIMGTDGIIGEIVVRGH